MHTKLIMEHQKTQSIISELKEEIKQSLERPLFEYFKEDPKRVETMSVSAPYIFADFSKNLLSSKTFKKLCQIPLTLQIEEKIKNMFGGDNVNTTEIRPALHTLLRKNRDTHLSFIGKQACSLHEDSTANGKHYP